MLEPTRRQTLGSLTALALSPALARGDAPPTDPKPEPVRTLTNTRLIFHGLPPELNPHPKNGWDKFDLPKVQAWLDLTWVGQPVKLSRRIAGIRVDANPQAKSRDEAWQVSIGVQPEVLRFRTLDIAVTFGMMQLGQPAAYMNFVGDENFAKKCERLPPNKIIVISGEIELLRLAASIRDEDFELKFGLKEFAIQGIAP